jgi:hypothetical protein
MQVPIKRTVCTPRQYAQAFIKAWHGLGYHEPPTKAQCGVLYAQWMVETGGAACWNWNIGNVKISQSQADAGLPWIDLPGTWEIIAGKRVTLPEGHPGRRFRAFGSLDQAMTEHLAFLRSKRYAPSWPAVEAGDPDAFAWALKNQGYYTAPVESYSRLMREMHAKWMKSPAFDDAAEEMTPDSSEADTLPQGYRVEQEPAIVHVTSYYNLEDDPDDEPPDAA